jgi:hypothetical protein
VDADTLRGDRSDPGGPTEPLLVGPDDPFRDWRELQVPVAVGAGRSQDVRPGAPGRVDGSGPAAPAAPAAVPSLTASDLQGLAELDDPHLVLSEAYVGSDRRRAGFGRSLARTTHVPRHSLLRIDALIVLAVVAVVVGVGLVVAGRPATTARTAATSAALPGNPLRGLPGSDPVASTVPTTVPTTAAAASPDAAATASGTVPTTVPPTAPVAAPPVADPSSPESMGAAALALVRYPWQSIPGFSIRFLPISDAPSPGFYGNTDFTWGRTGGVSTLYVYPGETLDQLAGITAFEIGHEVDAAYVEPGGGHEQIADILGVHPASWAPECDCAEQGYLSGWYAAAFSDYWSPGVGDWSSLAPPPSGATLAAVLPWLDPRVP